MKLSLEILEELREGRIVWSKYICENFEKEVKIHYDFILVFYQLIWLVSLSFQKWSLDENNFIFFIIHFSWS